MRSLVFACLLACLPLIALASSVPSAFPEGKQRGVATFRYLGFSLYEARLYTNSGAAFDWSKDFALELNYLRNLTEYDLIESTMRELERTGASLPIRKQLKACFADVRKGDTYLALTRGPSVIRFWLNGKPTCTLKHPQVKARFMGIFLGNNSRSKSFTRKLKGL
mgnify:CR=1 FL=1